ncbi:HTTM domain-containing protein [Agromyces sp. NPDC057679]|uniref:HTTM domain-containing protein n=1 Tax=Agromyces sp. NPDC057679 TaxID=3346207 RepID=UPI0036705640
MRLTEIRTDARAVAVARIGLGVATVFNAVEAFAILDRIRGGLLAMPVFDAAPRVETPLLAAWLMVAVAAGIALAIGWLTTPAAIVTVALNVAILLWDEQVYSSHRWLATLLVAYLAFARSDTTWSITHRRSDATVPWWPQLLMMSQLSVLYLFSALSKMNPYFITGAPLSKWVWLDLPWQLFFIASVLTVGVELFIAIGLWFRASRRLAALLGLGLHASIVVLMNNETFALIAFAITCVSLYPLFLRRPSLRHRDEIRPTAEQLSSSG